MAFLIGGANSAADTGYDVDNSCKFEYDNSEDLNRTLGTATNRKKFTISLWVKRSKLYVPGNETKYMMSAGDNASTNIDEFYFRFDTLDFSGYESSTTEFQLRSTPLYRDMSAWYNIVIAYDSTQGTASNRIKVYVNGARVTSWATETYPDENHEPLFNSAIEHHIGSNSASKFMDGYMAEVCFIDGTAYAASDFGEFDEDSPTIWKPKDVSSLTFGNNGFYLDFEDSGDLGDDESGNTNDFTENNLTAIDQMNDSPTNNFATLNPLDVNPGSAGDTFTEGNLKLVTNNSSNAAGSRSTIAVTSGKWYCEVKYTSTTAWNGVMATDTTITGDMTTGTIAWYQGTTLYVDGSNSATWGSAVSAGDIVGIALDMDNNRATISQGGQWWDTDAFDAATPTTYQNLTSGYDTWSFLCRSGSGASTSEWNFGSPIYSISSGNADANGYGNFEYAVPSGFLALCTKNLGSDGG